MTYSYDGKTLTKVADKYTTDVNNGTSKPWEDPVSGRNFQNDPERNNHLFDVHKPYRAKDDVRHLNHILKQLEDLGGGHNFDPDFKNNPQGKMRCTLHSGRKRKKDNKAFSSRHNDRNFESEPEHIAKDKSGNNILWNWCGSEYSFDAGELKYYEETFGEQLKQTNLNYENHRHKERCKTMDEWRKENMHAPEEQIYQIGKMEKCPDAEVSLACFKEYLEWLNKWNDEHGKPFFVLNWAMHLDEDGAPHFHIRKAWPYKDTETGLVTTDQTHSLLKAGVLPPHPEKKIDQKNNPKITFDKECREMWIKIARSHGLEIEDKPKPKNEVGKSLKDYQKEKDEWRNNVYKSLVELTAKNLGVLEKIADWEEIIPTIEKFDKLVEQNCKHARRTYDSEEFAGYIKQIVSAHAKDVKAAQDKGDAEIKRMDRELNGHNYWKGYDLHHQFGAKEINEMLSQASPEQLEKISAVMKANGFADLGSWMNNTKGWYRQFPKGMQIQKELERKNQGMSY